MVAPMGLIMLPGISGMFENKRLKSMIPHHSRAILVCRQANLTDPEIIELCNQIVRSQQDEINQMKGILQRY